MLEKDIERKLVLKAKKRGCMSVKLVSASFNGLPDRMILSPDGKAAFIELKSPGKKPRPLQLKRHAQLRAMNFNVYVIDEMEQIEEVLDEICTS